MKKQVSQFNISDLLQSVSIDVAETEVGTVTAFGDGVIQADGLDNVRMGELVRGHNQQLRVAPTGRWNVTTGWETAPLLGRQIESLLGKMTNDLAVWREVEQRFETLVTVGGHFEDWTGGFFLPLTTLVALSERRLEIDFDLYANGSDD